LQRIKDQWDADFILEFPDYKTKVLAWFVPQEKKPINVQWFTFSKKYEDSVDSEEVAPGRLHQLFKRRLTRAQAKGQEVM